MLNFSFSDHRINTRTWEEDGTKVRSHTLELYSEDGSRDQAILVFDAELDTDRLGAIVGYVTHEQGQGTSVVGWFPLEEFGKYKRILERGGDLSVHYRLREGETDNGYLEHLGIGPTKTIMSVARACEPANKSAAPARALARM
ncbi:hypothetical protein [Amaricoccus tamworthensis]|uniref:hypothetical protein n=1 Tax=Amaricoccus tamworthensis TaxID=57002 RepID=UPI003C7AEF5C